MKAYIQTNKNGEFYNVNAFQAYVGFEHLGFEVVKYFRVEEIIDNSPEAIIVGGVGNVRKRLKVLGVNLPQNELEYPNELTSYLGRKIWQNSLQHLRNHEVGWNIFVKPIETKLFSGKVLGSFNDLVQLNVPYETDVWCSEVINIVTEWRCFVRYNELLDVRYYNGKFDSKLDLYFLKQAITDFKSAPASYALDVGITDEGKMVLVEVTDGHSLGAYGMGAVSYAKFLSARWAELTNTKDYLNF